MDKTAFVFHYEDGLIHISGRFRKTAPALATGAIDPAAAYRIRGRMRVR